MNVPTKLGAFAAALAVIFGIAFGIGRAVGPVGEDVERHAPSEHIMTPSTEAHR